MTEKNKFVWIIAGGIMQVPMLELCKDRNYQILLTDGDPESVGKKYADQFVNIDTYDVNAHIDLAYSMREKPDAVLSVGADIGPTVSAVADELGLPAVGYEVAKRVRNKALMRSTLGLDIPVWKEVSFSDPFQDMTWKAHCAKHNTDPFPCVIKPLEKAGSRGVSIVTSPFGWRDAVSSAKKTDNGMHKTFLIEKIIPSEIEIATDNFVVNGKVIFANAVKRYFHKKIFGLEVGHLNPYILNTDIKNQIRWASKKLGIDWGPFKCDFIYNSKDGWVIAECATRLSGGFDHSYAAPIATGKDITGFMLDMALGESLSNKDSRLWNRNKKFAFTYAPILKPGKVSNMELPICNGEQYPWLKNIFITMKNNTIQKLENCSQRPLFIITEGDTEYEAIKRAKIIERKIEIEYE